MNSKIETDTQTIRRWARWAGCRELSDDQALDRWTRECEQLPEGARILSREHPDYPSRLLSMEESPKFIYSWGESLEPTRTLGVVGSRAIDAEGHRIAAALCADLAPHTCIVSGGARGIDAIAHDACLKARGQTIVVLPGGLDRLTPRRNRKLFDRIVAEGGRLITEYPLGSGVRKYHFHRRNKLIAHLSDALLIVRARESGGTHITAEASHAADRPIFAVPGSPEDRFSIGCNMWIRRGASMAWKAEQILEDLGWDDSQPELFETRKVEHTLSTDELAIVSILEQGAATLDMLAEESGLPIGELHRSLIELELAGYCVRDTERGEYVMNQGACVRPSPEP